MELDDMKSYWKKLPAESAKPAGAFKSMTKENGHPVLKGIRRQMLIEMTGWILFLIVFYDFFDGHTKPLYLNALVVSTGAFVAGHNLMGYLMARNLHADGNMAQVMSAYIAKVKTYSAVSIMARVVSMTAVLMFFADAIQFTKEKYMMLAGILVVFMVQIGLLIRLWIKRIVELEGSVRELKNA
jgi:hypothetical protein